MKLRILRNLGSGLPPYQEGQEVDEQDDVAQRLLAAGLAEPVGKKAQQETAKLESVPPNTSPAAADPPKSRK